MTFLFDEQISPRLVDALRALGERVVHVEKVDQLGKGASDEEVLTYASKMDIAIISLDRRIRSNPHLKAMYFASGVGIYFLKSARKQKTDRWEITQLLIKYWLEIKQDCERRRKPFMVLVENRSGLKRFH